jgi:hypothetical protein
MASTGQNYISQFTVSNQGITDLRELLFLTLLQQGSISETADFMTGVRNGSRLGGIGELEPVGVASSGCSPAWKNSNLATVEKQWELGAYEVAEKICYADLEETLVQFSMKNGTDRADLTGTDYLDIILEPVMRTALEKMLWRMVWFGDKSAANVADGGVITAGVNPALFTVNDGLFKRLLAVTAASAQQRITVAANAQATYDDQLQGIRSSGVATSVFDKLIYNAPVKLRQKSDKIILCTQTMADALAMDIKANNKGSDLQWESLFDGFVSATKYNGQTVLALPVWDEMIQSFENDGTKWNKPHRALYVSKSQLKAGTESSDMIAELKVWFNEDEQMNKMLCKDKIGTLLWEDSLFMYAY